MQVWLPSGMPSCRDGPQVWRSLTQPERHAGPCRVSTVLCVFSMDQTRISAICGTVAPASASMVAASVVVEVEVGGLDELAAVRRLLVDGIELAAVLAPALVEVPLGVGLAGRSGKHHERALAVRPSRCAFNSVSRPSACSWSTRPAPS